MQRNKQTLANNVTRDVLKYMTASGMLFTQKDINNIHMIISKGMRGSFPKLPNFLPDKTKSKKAP